jgi:Cdc6-like AAA superfamily ATPase
MLETIARQRVFASVTRHEELVELYVTSDRLIGAQGDQRPEVRMMRTLANEPPPRFLQILGPTGAGKTSMILRVLADLARREPSTLLRPHEILLVNVGDDPSRLDSPAAFMHTMVQLVARQGHRFSSVSPEVLVAAAADERTTTGPQVSHRATIDAKVFSYSAELKEAYETAKFGDDPTRARQDFEDVLTLVSKEHRPVILIDDTEHFVHRGADGGVDVDSVSNLFHHGIRALAELQRVDVIVAIHPRYQDVPAVQEVGSRFGFEAIDVPALRADSDKPGLSEILAKRLARHGIEVAIGDVVSPEVVSQLEAHYFANDHDLRAVLELAAGAASRAVDDAAERIEPRHLQPLLDTSR